MTARKQAREKGSTSVAGYLAALPEDRRRELKAVLDLVRRDGFKTAGRRLDMGKSCIRFQRADDLALEAIAEVVRSTTVESFVALAQAARRPEKARSPARR